MKSFEELGSQYFDESVREIEMPDFGELTIKNPKDYKYYHIAISDGAGKCLVRICEDGTVEAFGEKAEEQAAKVFYECLQIEGKTLHQKIAALEARVAELEHAITEDILEGREHVNEAHFEFGYDSLRFADVRHGWLYSTSRIRQLVRDWEAKTIQQSIALQERMDERDAALRQDSADSREQ